MWIAVLGKKNYICTVSRKVNTNCYALLYTNILAVLKSTALFFYIQMVSKTYFL